MTIREPQPADQGYVVKTWTRSLASCKPWKSMTAAVFRAVEANVEAVMDRSDTRALIATAVAPDLCGWIVWTPMNGAAALHYLYVRKSERTRGIGRALFERAGISLRQPLVFTMRGPVHRWLEPKAPGAVYVPLEDFLHPRTKRTRPEARL